MSIRTAISYAVALVGLFFLCPTSALQLDPSDALTVVETSFVVDYRGSKRRSPDLVGSHINIGSGFTLRVDDVRIDALHPGVYLHRFSVRRGGNDWTNPCEPDAQGRQEGFPLRGRRDANGRYVDDPAAVSFACTSGAEGKCILWGLAPWKMTPSGESLRPAYEACIRMARADYCATGEPSTVAGKTIVMLQRHELGRAFQRPDAQPALRFEGGWTQDGAVCVHHLRTPEIITQEQVLTRCPALQANFGDMCTPEEAARLGATIFNYSY